MKVCSFTCVVFGLLSLSFAAYSQTGSISGRVLDSETLKPLPFANVFIANTTLGMPATPRGEFDIHNIPVGSPDVVFSFVGYQTYRQRVNIKEGADVKLVIKLIPLKEQLSEVEVKASRDKVWERQLRRFEKVFLGSDDFARQCKILNEFVIDFTESGDGKLSASASSPIIVENQAMGYTLNFYLRSFTTDGASYSIVGSTQFIELKATSDKQAAVWMNNRRAGYTGSTRHFLKSLLEGTSQQQGFQVYEDRMIGRRKGVFEKDLGWSIAPIEATTIVAPGNSLYEKKLTLKGRIEVHYIHKGTQQLVYKNIDHAVSWLEFKSDMVRVSNEGLPINPLDIIVSGDMSLARVSNMLPLDFQPSHVIPVITASQLRAVRWFESVYTQTSKPFYYPGEMLWFKAYMNYNVRSMADTLSGILYVDLVNSRKEVVDSKFLKITGGSAAGAFALRSSLPKGTYALVAYTNWMRNYGSSVLSVKVIPVLDMYERIKQDTVEEILGASEQEITLDKVKYTTRDLVNVSIKIADETGAPIPADLSVSVTDIKRVPSAGWAKDNITSSMMKRMDIDVAAGAFTYNIEHGITLAGSFVPTNAKPVKADITFVRGSFEDTRKVTTDEQGAFVLRDLDVADSAMFNYQARHKGAIEGKIVIRPRTFPSNDFDASDYDVAVVKEESVQRMLSSYEISRDAILLEGVEVKATRLDSVSGPQNVYGTASVSLSGDEMARFGTIESLLREKAPGFLLTFDGMHYVFVNLRSTKPPRLAEPVLTIDNREVIPGSNETIGDYLMQIQVATIDRIEVSGVGRSYTGANGSNGVIAVFLKKSTPREKSTFHSVTVKGYETPATFTNPSYSNATEDHSQADFRTTLFWKHDLLTDTNGHAEFSFYTSDLVGKYRIVIEGVTQGGKLIHAEKIVDVEPR